jgi:hypothetical protein
VTIAHHIPFAGPAALPRPLYVPVAVVMGASVLGLSLTPIADGFLSRVVLFYLATSIAYGLMPYVRRGDIPLVAAWVILLSELAPCLAGQLISPSNVAADALGVMMATGPMYIARMRQVLQGDLRPVGRRASDRSEA